MTLRTRALAATAACAALALLVALVLLPPLPAAAPAPSWSPATPVVRGVFHVHTRRSDGTGSIEDVASAAAKAGLQFVIITDHGDATRPPDPPAYRSGVLCIDAVEISTTAGHYAALGMGRAPYPLAGEPRDVADDVRRLGGFGVVTHPLSPKPDLEWKGWDAEVDAIEWLNGDSVWRDAPMSRLVRAAWTYPLRQVPSIGSLFRRPKAIAAWDRLSRRRPIVGLVGTDAHARLGFRDGPEPYVNPVYLRIPSYEAAFGVASLRVAIPQRLTHEPSRDAAAIVGAIRAGHVHGVVDALAGPAAFEFTARSGEVAAAEGDTLPAADPVVVRVRANPPAGGWIVLFRDGEEVHRVAANELEYASDRLGVYRAEVWLPARGPDGFVPWIVGNPVYVGVRSRPVADTPIDTSGPTTPLEAADDLWGVERDARSAAELQRSATSVGLRYTLASAAGSTAYAALNATTTIARGATGIAFAGAADRPMRVSVQLRVVNAGEGKRWTRSVYLDQTAREIVIPFSGMTPVGAFAAGPADVAGVGTVLFVVDALNTARGSSGRFVLERVRFTSPTPPTR